MKKENITDIVYIIVFLLVSLCLILAAVYFLWNIPMGLSVLIGSVFIASAIASLGYKS